MKQRGMRIESTISTVLLFMQGGQYVAADSGKAWVAAIGFLWVLGTLDTIKPNAQGRYFHSYCSLGCSAAGRLIVVCAASPCWRWSGGSG